MHGGDLPDAPDGPVVDSPGAASIGVETAVQSDPGTGGTPVRIERAAHRVPAGTTIRALLARAGQVRLVELIDAGEWGLARFGRRAWLDDTLNDGDRIEIVQPIVADAKAARRERVAARVTAARRRRGTPPG